MTLFEIAIFAGSNIAGSLIVCAYYTIMDTRNERRRQTILEFHREQARKNDLERMQYLSAKEAYEKGLKEGKDSAKRVKEVKK